jgi:hypothetical protein
MPVDLRRCIALSRDTLDLVAKQGPTVVIEAEADSRIAGLASAATGNVCPVPMRVVYEGSDGGPRQ